MSKIASLKGKVLLITLFDPKMALEVEKYKFHLRKKGYDIHHITIHINTHNDLSCFNKKTYAAVLGDPSNSFHAHRNLTENLNANMLSTKCLPFEIDDQMKVIILAHGSRQRDYISTTKGACLNIADIAAFLKKNMKPGNLNMRITVKACESGLGSSYMDHENSIAGNLARELHSLGLKPRISAYLSSGRFCQSPDNSCYWATEAKISVLDKQPFVVGTEENITLLRILQHLSACDQLWQLYEFHQKLLAISVFKQEGSKIRLFFNNDVDNKSSTI